MDNQETGIPDTIKIDLVRARKIRTSLEGGDRRPLADFIGDHYGLFINFAKEKVYRKADAADAVHGFCEKVLLKGEIFGLYQGDRNCRLKSYILHALLMFILTLNSREEQRRHRESSKDATLIQLPAAGFIPPPGPPATLVPQQQLRRLSSSKIRKYIDDLLSTAIGNTAEKILLVSCPTDLRISMLINGSETGYSPRPQEKLIPLILPRIKFIAGFNQAEKSFSQRNSLSMCISSRHVILQFCNSFAANGNERVEIDLKYGSAAYTSNSGPDAESLGTTLQTFPEDDTIEDEYPEIESIDPPAATGDIEGKARPLHSFLDVVSWHTDDGDLENAPGISTKRYEEPTSAVEEEVGNKETLRLYAKIVKEALSELEKTHPTNAALIRLRMDDYEFMDMAVALETDPWLRASFESLKLSLIKTGASAIRKGKDKEKINLINLLVKKADNLKHQYERKDGPSALFRFHVIVERLLVEKNMHLDIVPDLAHGQQPDNNQLSELLAEAIRRMCVCGDTASANIAKIQISLMRPPEIALLLGTLNGRRITEDREKPPEVKKLQELMTIILTERGEELTSCNGKPSIRKIQPSVTKT